MAALFWSDLSVYVDVGQHKLMFWSFSLNNDLKTMMSMQQSENRNSKHFKCLVERKSSLQMIGYILLHSIYSKDGIEGNTLYPTSTLMTATLCALNYFRLHTS